MHKEEHVKIISNFINNNVLYLDIYQYIKKKDINSIKYIEPFINKINVIIQQDDDEENEETSSFSTIENDIKNININIDNVNINIFNIKIPENYFDRITTANIIDL